MAIALAPVAALAALTASAPTRIPRRAVLSHALLPLLPALPASAAPKSRTQGYRVQRSEREWSYVLAPEQYFILREGGTEAPNSSPLVREKRAGTFKCAGCGTPLFDSSQKFESGTGWPSFASPLKEVETVSAGGLLGAVGAVTGSEIRCGVCGGHLGDVFPDGFLFPGTPAARTGKRYCLDGACVRSTLYSVLLLCCPPPTRCRPLAAPPNTPRSPHPADLNPISTESPALPDPVAGAALSFEPSGGGEAVLGYAPMKAGPPELPSWLQPPVPKRPVA